MSDIFLLSTERALSDFEGKLLKSDEIFFVANGTNPLMGKRIENAYVDYMCYKDPNYEDVLHRIRLNMALSPNAGKIILI